jgi:hypothetical protein
VSNPSQQQLRYATQAPSGLQQGTLLFIGNEKLSKASPNPKTEKKKKKKKKLEIQQCNNQLNNNSNNNHHQFNNNNNNRLFALTTLTLRFRTHRQVDWQQQCDCNSNHRA